VVSLTGYAETATAPRAANFPDEAFTHARVLVPGAHPDAPDPVLRAGLYQHPGPGGGEEGASQIEAEPGH